MLALTVFALFYISNQARKAYQNLDQILATELQSQLKCQVKIGKVIAENPGKFVAEDIYFGTLEKKPKTLAKLRRVVIDYDFYGIVLHHKSLSEAISRIDLIGPEIHLARDRKGQFSFQKLLKAPKKPTRVTFQGIVQISDGQVFLEDSFPASAQKTPLTNHLINIEGTFDASKISKIYLVLMGKDANHRMGPWHVQVRSNTSSGALDVLVQSPNIDGPYWWKYFTKIQSVIPASGKADLNLRVTRLHSKSRLDYLLDLYLHHVSGKVPVCSVPVTDLNGPVQLIANNLSMTLSGKMAGMPVQLNGSLLNLKKPQLNLSLQIKQITESSLLKTFPTVKQVPVTFDRPGNASVRILGITNSPVVLVKINTPQAQLMRQSIKNLKIQASYADKTAQLSHIYGEYADGNIDGVGVIDLKSKSPTIGLTGKAFHINLRKASIIGRSDISGIGDFQFSVIQTNTKWQADLNAQLNNGSISTIRYKKFYGNLHLKDNSIQISKAILNGPQGDFQAAGSISTRGDLNLKIQGTNAELSQVLAPLKIRMLSGTANFNGQVTGTAQSPHFNGSVDSSQGQISLIPYDAIHADFSATKDQITFSNAIIESDSSVYSLTGKLAYTGGRIGPLDLKLQGQNVSVEKLTGLLNMSSDLTGKISGTTEMKGTLGNLAVSGHLVMSEGEYHSIPVDAASGDFRFSHGVFTLSNIYVKSGKGDLNCSGTVGPGRLVDLTAEGKSIPLNLLKTYTQPYLQVNGFVDANARVKGVRDNPDVLADLRASSLDVNTEKFDSLNASIWVSDRKATILSAQLKKGESSIEMDRAMLDTKLNQLEINAHTSKIPVETFMNIAENSPYLSTEKGIDFAKQLARIPRPFSGMMTASVSLEGPVATPKGQVSLNFDTIHAGTVRLDSIQADAGFTGKSVILNEFKAARGETLLKANHGQVGYDGSLDLDFDVYNLQLASLRSFIPAQKNLSGQVDLLSFTVGGDIKNPKLTGNLDISNVSCNGIQLDQIRSAPIIVENGRATCDELIFRRGSKGLLVSGSVPMNLASLRIPDDQPLDVKVSLTDSTLGILSSFIPAIPEAQGELKAALDIGGSLKEPKLSGQATLANGYIRIPSVSTPLTNIQSKIIFQNQVVHVDHLTGNGASGNFAVTGDIDLSRTSDACYRLNLIAHDLELSEENLAGYHEIFRGKINANLGITGPLKSPLIAGLNGEMGQVRVSDTTLTFPTQKTTVPKVIPAYWINPKFSLAVTADRNVTFIGPSMRLQTKGDMTLTGTLAAPRLVGYLTTNQGLVYYPYATFRLVDGRADFVVMPPVPARVELNARARTTMGSTQITMAVAGPLDGLHFDITSVPPLPESRLLSLLLRQDQLESALKGQDPSAVLGSETLRILTSQLEPQVLMPIELALQQALGLEEFSLELGNLESPTLQMERSLVGKFYVRYLRLLVGPGGLQERDRITLGYHLSPTFQIGWSRNDQQVEQISVEGTLRF